LQGFTDPGVAGMINKSDFLGLIMLGAGKH